ncbi:MAG TPA: Rieske 2Fe-2S domain-containing protein [Verrucomicrobiae bacterium]|nr:Rieske 2Fe-2S domain-containing protein [Verrucomicrobiae bacterium]
MAIRRIALARVDELKPGMTRRFAFERDGQRTEAFVANFRGQYVAFVNQCVHLAISLDLDDNDFFTGDGDFFVCKTHGSVYEPRGGKCIGGPGQGKALEPLPVVVEGNAVYLELTE